MSAEAKFRISLERVIKLAEEVGEKSHGLECVQLPIDVLMSEAFVHKW